MTLYYAHAEPSPAEPTDISIRPYDGPNRIDSTLLLSSLARTIERLYTGRWVGPAGNDLARYQVESALPRRAA
jgi:hypothetical protein